MNREVLFGDEYFISQPQISMRDAEERGHMFTKQYICYI